eukprot:TRINITY_DN5450_c0_g1_i1.p3 TRINITY_DN5450_c0_g1~~TRINITY_DN5450_c0_g1_i1.p3  ORF type:complete len:190 (-),score=72.04 TRINITY_DN5450_c0_g1_i1:24-593(-)
MEGVYSNGTNLYKRAHFFPQVDRLARIKVRESAATFADADTVKVVFEVGDAVSPGGNGVFGGYVVTAPSRRQERIWIHGGKHNRAWEFLIYADCGSAAGSEIPCGTVLAADVADDPGPDAACPAIGCDCTIDGNSNRCFSSGPLKDLTVFVGWQGTDSQGKSMTSKREFPSKYTLFSLGDVTTDAFGGD